MSKPAAECNQVPATECYRVRANHEWANIYLRHWSQPGSFGGAKHYCGEIVINSSFGVYGNWWTHCGNNFKKFLTELEFSYFMEKTRPEYKRFDFEASIFGLKLRVVEERRQGGITKAQAREIWEGLESMESLGGAHKFVEELYEIEALRHITTEPYEYARDTPDPDSRGFWRDIWPAFIAELKAETATVERA